MRRENQSSVSGFLLLGLPIRPEQQGVFFALFLGMYLTTVLGNLLIILLIRLDSRLHTPMYFFLSHLAFTDVSFSSVTVPKMLRDMHSKDKFIPYAGCILQMYFFIVFGCLDCLLLAVMAYDRQRSSMRRENQSSVSGFLLLGLPIRPEQQGVFFALFLGMYLTTVLGNLLIILLIRLDSRLHTPMYFFLSHLAFTDVSFSSVTVPKMLRDMHSKDKFIPYAGCILQMYFFIVFGCLDCLLLAVMAYDRYVAICHPLHYTAIMREGLCVLLVAGSWLVSCGSALLDTLLLAQVSFCADNIIPHFFCSLPVLLKLSCSNTSVTELVIFTVGTLVVIFLFIAILVSYGRIGTSILRVPSTTGLRKALSTCGSHLSVVQRSSMRRENQSSVSGFLLLGLPIRPEQQGVFFALFLGMYLTTVLGNLLIILLIRLDSRLHTPMYFFLSHLAFTDVSFASVTVPKMLRDMHSKDKFIPYAGCILQMYFFLVFGCLDSLLLAVMAYDRYMAICHPLHYTTIMREGLCVLLVAGSWLVSCGTALLHTLLLAQVSFCADNIIPHFFCDLPLLLKLSCSNTSVNELAILTAGAMLGIIPLSGIMASYGRIGASILRVPSTTGLRKALSTCGSHLSVVSLFYGTIIALYYSSSLSDSSDKAMIASLMYTAVTPMLNPFIYSLRNRDIKLALGILFRNNILVTKQSSSMRRENQSSVSGFLLLGLPIRPEQQGVFFALFLGMYLTTVLGNLLIILLIRLDSRLHSSHLAFTDVSFASVTVPKMLRDMHSKDKFIPYAGCILQMYFFIVFGCLDSLLLAVMAYDRYVAICHPLRYTTIMREGLCVLLVAGSWLVSCGSALVHTLFLAQLSFCANNIIPHFFCSLSVLLKLSCSNTSLNELVIFIVGALVVIFPFIAIVVSYGRIGTSILRVPSTTALRKALSTCGSHLSVVSLFYGTIIVLHYSSSLSDSNDKSMTASLMYTVVTPMLNPFIYSLRNRDMKGAMGKLLRRKIFFSM
ncbi:Olfactory receptor 1J2 [Pteropus alecto]|uniref:Olfactory receptor 1J2 n=1 Tax=Pteropus alecto TaxID=9402 RepID=L5K5K3_PTEAL|nr:Olfactory receptor 1J2 [Pteropus alecto]